jgi:hypothetical protein
MPSFLTSLLIAASVTGSTAPAGPPEGVFDPPPRIRHQLEEAATKRAAFEAHTMAAGIPLKNWAGELPPPTYDVLHYELDLFVDPTRQTLSGSVTLDLEAVEDGLSSLILDADLGLRVLSVLQLMDDRYPYDTPRELTFDHTESGLAIQLAQALAAGDAVRIQVTYGGHTWRSGLIGATGVNWYSNGGTPVIHTFAQPYGARVWWPCNDRPDDKATVTLRVTVPEDLDVAANGLERSRQDNGDGTATSVWSSIYPVPTYLVVMHISDFAYSESTYTGLDGTTMPVGLWAMPQVAAQAENDLAVTVPQIEVMAEHWGEYPFLEEKYGNATVFFGGGMEHQTMTTLSVYAVGDPWMQWLNVHELGHQWWGDWITMDDWRHIWLNEGFATHTEWLWAEHLGPDVLAEYLEEEDYIGQFSGAVYDNPEPFSWTVYAKGSWVAWMLRHVVGDEAFFQAMAAYRADHAGSTATTDDLRAAMEAASGMTLDWFFDQWVYGLYRPRYVYDWQTTGGTTLELTVRQVQTNTGLFRMPMDIRVTTSAGVEDHRVWFEAEAEQTIQITTQAEATGVEIDPETHVLCEIAHVSQPDLELGPDFPDGYDFGLVVGSDRETRTVPLTNTGGVNLIVDGIWPQSGSSFGLEDPPEFPLTIPPGESRDVEIYYDPGGTGRQADWFYIQSNDPDRDGGAYLRVYGTAALYSNALLAAPASTSVGRTPVGGTSETAFDALNLGGEPLAVQTTVEGDGFHLAQSVPAVFAPGSSNEIRIRFTPTEPGDATGSVIFHAGDPDVPIKTVRLTATADGAPRIEIAPHVLALGIGTGDATGSVSIANSGHEDLFVSVVETAVPFAIAGDAPEPFVLEPGTQRSVVVALDAPEVGTHHGHLTIHSNDPAVPLARIPLQAHVGETPPDEMSYPGAASGPGLGDTTWATRAYLLNPMDAATQVDVVFRPVEERESGHPDAGLEIPARSQRVVTDLVAAAGASGTGGVNLRASHPFPIAVSRTFASGAGGTYGQLVPAVLHQNALDGTASYLLAGLDGNGGFHTNVGVLNVGDADLALDLSLYDSEGQLVGSRRITAVPRGFNQVVSIVSKLTAETIRSGYAILTALDPEARFLAYASVVDDASHDPTLALPQPMQPAGSVADLVVPTVASLPGYLGTRWASRVDVVNTASEPRTVTLEYVREDGSSVTSMAMEIPSRGTLRFDDVVRGLFGEGGKGWLVVTASGPGVHATSRTFNDSPDGTFGQLVPATDMAMASTAATTTLLPGLSSSNGFRTNIGLTSLANEDIECTIAFFTNDGVAIGEVPVPLPARSFVQLERVLADELGHVGEAWAEVICEGEVFVHASVVDGQTGDPTYVPGSVALGLRQVH